MVDPEITDDASSCAAICAANCAAAITGRKSVAVLVAVAVADTDEDVETEYDADPLVEIDAEGVLVCFGEMLADDEGDVDTVGILEDVTLTEAVAEILIDPVPNGLTVPELDNDPEIDDDCVCEEVGEPDDDGVCV